MRYKDFINLSSEEVDNNPPKTLIMHKIDECDAVILGKIFKIDEEIQELMNRKQELYKTLMS